MAFVDMSTNWAYKTLIIYQDLNKLGVNDKLFNDQLVGNINIPTSPILANTQALKGDSAVSGTPKKMISRDASNVVQLAEAGVEVRVPADPTNALGVATKQYVDGATQLQTQAPISGATGINPTYNTLLNYTGVGRVHAIGVVSGSGGTETIRITIDGGTPFTVAGSGAAGNFFYMTADLQNLIDSGAVTVTGRLLEINFKTSIKIEFRSNTGAGTGYLEYSHA